MLSLQMERRKQLQAARLHLATPLPPPFLLTYIALGLAALGNYGYNGGMGRGVSLQNNLLIPRGAEGGEKREGSVEFRGNRARRTP